MAEVGKILTRKVAASTILEVVISMVIIVFVIGIALMILSNVMRLSLSEKELKAKALVQQELLHSNLIGNKTDTTYQANNFKIEKTVTASGLGKNLYVIDVKAFDVNSIQIAELKNLIIHEDR